MRIGVDLDNTLVSYDALFHRIALEQGAIPADLPRNKVAVRDHLRGIGREAVWTGMQGTVYGARMDEAEAFPGAIDFLRWAAARGIELCIISHKTRHPFVGPQHDLHAAARGWVERHLAGIVDPANVFFELTRQEKVARIAAAGCDFYIDDLPEVLLAPDFPGTTRRILFDPESHHQAEGANMRGLRRMRSWTEIHALFRREAVTQAVAAALDLAREKQGSLKVETGGGGGNSRIYRVSLGGRELVAKEYFRDRSDPRDRLQAEWAFLEFAQGAGIGCVPRPVARDAAAGVGVYEHVDGRRLGAGDATAARVAEAAAFFLELNRHRGRAAALGDASEACFSIAEHLAMVDGRVARLGSISSSTEEDRAAREFAATLEKRWRELRDDILKKVRDPAAPVEERCVSPSDFGFHNALLRPDGTLCFLDFEYAGWDDPAKMVGDFFAHPGVPVAREHFDAFVRAALGFSPHAAALEARARLLEPVFRLKWCCIVLNEFVPEAARRRSFAAPQDDRELRKQQQLAKARELLASI